MGAVVSADVVDHPDVAVVAEAAKVCSDADVLAALCRHADVDVVAAAVANPATRLDDVRQAVSRAPDWQVAAVAAAVLDRDGVPVELLRMVAFHPADVYAAATLWGRVGGHGGADDGLRRELIEQLAAARGDGQAAAGAVWLRSGASEPPAWLGKSAPVWTAADSCEVAVVAASSPTGARQWLTRPDAPAARAAAAARLPLDDADGFAARAADAGADRDRWLAAALRANPSTPPWWLAVTAGALPPGDTDGLRGLLAHPGRDDAVTEAAVEVGLADAALAAELLKDAWLSGEQVAALVGRWPADEYALVALRAARHAGTPATLRAQLAGHGNVWVRRAAKRRVVARRRDGSGDGAGRAVR